MMTATVCETRLTLPDLSVRLAVKVDFLRRRFKQVPELAAMLDQAGPTRFVRESNLARIRELLTK